MGSLVRAVVVTVVVTVAADVRAGRHATEAEWPRVLDEEQAPASRAEEFGAPEGIVEAFEQLDGDTSCG